jgi:autotransporter-associated beta strand protein
MTGASGSVWTTPATWQDGAAPSAANDYTVENLTLSAPSLTATATAAFDGRSLSVTSGTLSFPGSSGGTVTHTYAFPNLAVPLAISGSTLSFASTNATTKAVNAAIAFSGDNVITYASTNFTHNLTFAQALSGTGKLTFNWTGNATGRNVNINGGGNSHTGTVVLNTASGTANFNLNQNLGATTYEIRSSWRLNNAVASGLDSATSVTVVDPASSLSLAAPWTGPTAALTVQNGNVLFGTATSYPTSSIGSLTHEGGTLQFDIAGPGAADQLALSGDYTTTSGLIDIFLRGDPGSSTYDLITYAGARTGTPQPLLITPTRLVANYSTGSASNGKVTVSFTGSTANLVWKGNDAFLPNQWDTDATPNFDNAGSSDKFLAIDSVTFDDSAASFTPTLSGIVIPKSVAFTNVTNAYTLGGSGSIGGNATLAKSGAGNLTITAANSHTGGTSLSAGRLRIGNNAALGAGTTTLSGGTLSSDGTAARTLANPIALAGTFTLGHATDTGAVNFSGPITLVSDSTVQVESATEMTWSGIVGGTGALEYARSAASPVARLNLNNTGNTFTGDVTVTTGRLRFASGAASDGAFGNPANKIILNGTPVANFNNNEGTASLQQSTGAAASIAATREIVLNTGKEGTFHTWGGFTMSVHAPISGGGILRKEDSGTLLLTGDNSYSGGTKVTNGIVQVKSDTGLGSGGVTLGAVNNTLTARLELDGATIANDITLNSAGLTGFQGALSAIGGVTSTVNGSVTISSAVGNGGHLGAIGAGSVLRVNGPLVIPNATIPNVRVGTVELAGGGSYPRLDQGEGLLRLGADNGIAPGAQLRLAVSNTGTFDLNGHDQSLSQLNRAAAAAATVTNSAAGASVLTIDGTTDHSFSGTLTEGVGSGGLGLVKKGSSTFTLAAASSYTGTTSVEGGRLVINAATGTTPVTVAAGGTLAGTGPLNGSITVAGTLAPASGAGVIFANDSVAFGPGADYAWEIADWNGSTAGTDWDLVNAVDLLFSATPASPLTVVVSGTAANFTESAKTFEIARSVNPISGFDAAAIQVDASGFAGTGIWSVGLDGSSTSLLLTYQPAAGTPFSTWAAANGVPADPSLDSDSDGIPAGIEFVIGGDPSGPGSDSSALLPTVTTDATYLNFTYRRTDAAAGMPEGQQPYVEYGSALTGWTTAVPGEDGVVVQETSGSPDLVTVRIPRALAAGGRLFARLAVDIE